MRTRTVKIKFFSPLENTNNKKLHTPCESWLVLGAIKNTRLAHSAKYMKQSSVVTIDRRRHMVFGVLSRAPPTGASSAPLKRFKFSWDMKEKLRLIVTATKQ